MVIIFCFYFNLLTRLFNPHPFRFQTSRHCRSAQNLNLPRSDGDVRADTRGIISRDMPDGFQEYQYENEYHDLPQIVDITELHEQENEIDFMDPDYEPGSSARSRGNVARKRKVAKEGKPRSRSRGRKTRSQTVKDKELVVD